MRRTDPPKLEERRRVSASADSAEEIKDTTGVGPWSFIVRGRREDVDLQQSVFFHSVSERVAAYTEHASRLDLIAFGRIKGLLNKLFF